MIIRHLKILDCYYTMFGENEKYTDCPVILIHHKINGAVEDIEFRYKEYSTEYVYELQKQASGLFYGIAMRTSDKKLFPNSTLSLSIYIDNKKYSIKGRYEEEDCKGEWFVEAEIEKNFEI